MRRISLILLGLVCAGAALAPAAEEGPRGARSLRVKFLRLVEQRIESREHLAMMVQQVEGSQTATVIVPARNQDLLAAVRKLTPGQVVELQYVNEGNQKWLKSIAAAGGGERDRREGGADAPRREGGGDVPRVRREGEGEVPRVRREGEGDVPRVRREGEGDVPRVRREGEGDVPRVRREGGEGREVPRVRREGDGEGEGARVRREGGDRVEADLREQIIHLRRQVEEMEKALKEIREQLRRRDAER